MVPPPGSGSGVGRGTILTGSLVTRADSSDAGCASGGAPQPESATPARPAAATKRTKLVMARHPEHTAYQRVDPRFAGGCRAVVTARATCVQRFAGGCSFAGHRYWNARPS